MMDARFVLLTAAKNEEKYIEYAIKSVIRQIVWPVAWFIVDDGSCDATAQIVSDYAKNYSFIQLIQCGGSRERSFGAQYRAINMAFEEARKLSFDFVGVHDADIAVISGNYYAKVIRALIDDCSLGIAGGFIHERAGNEWRSRAANSKYAVAGGIQMFRRECFEAIGGYVPLLFGGEDWLAQIDAKRAGWGVKALPELPVKHYRPTSSADGRLKGLIRLGMMDASFGSHPAFEILKCAKRIKERPFVLGSVLRFLGYLRWNVSRRQPLLPSSTVEYLRKEQLHRIYERIPYSTRYFAPR
jgi:glycosyltransferase involved in cell wall biosynthesis